ncbi:MAG: hypothetical protein U9Q12_03620 [Patescibacteria group bacterium]|nr:hypothetical protein [Patescibacteria group bacterium]
MKMGEPQMKMPESKKKKEGVITINEDGVEEDIYKAFGDIDADVKIEGDKITTIEGDDARALEDSIDRAFGADATSAEVDWAQESKAVVAIAQKKLFEDKEIVAYMEDPDYENIVRQVAVDMTTDEEQIRIFQEGINAASNKAGYVEQATSKLVVVMKEEAKKRIMDNVAGQGNNS